MKKSIINYTAIISALTMCLLFNTSVNADPIAYNLGDSIEIDDPEYGSYMISVEGAHDSEWDYDIIDEGMKIITVQGVAENIDFDWIDLGLCCYMIDQTGIKVQDEDGFDLEFVDITGPTDGAYEVAAYLDPSVKKRVSLPYYAPEDCQEVTVIINDEYSVKIPLYETPEFEVTSSSDAQTLTKDDFLVTITGETNDLDKQVAAYDYDVSVYLDSVGSSGAYYYTMTNETENGITSNEKNGDVCTYRNIEAGKSSKDDVLNAYGIGVNYVYNTATDPVYNSIAASGDEYSTYVLQNCVGEVLFYSYRGLYQIAFYLSDSGQVTAIFYTNSIVYEADKTTVQAVQGILNNLGYDCGTPDGVAGNNTRAAIGKYQEENGLFVSGIIDDELLKSLNYTGNVILGQNANSNVL